MRETPLPSPELIAANYVSQIVEMASCGLLLSTVLRSAMFVSGEVIVMVVSQPSSPGASTLLSLRSNRSKLGLFG